MAIVLPKDNNTINNTKINNSKTSNKLEEQTEGTNKNSDDFKENTPKKEIVEDKNINNNSSEEKNETNINNEETHIPQATEKNEEDVINYFETISSSSAEGNLKKGFVNIIDFLFYNKEIDGITFDELTSEAKLKIIKLALKMDAKTEEYFPGYKESISATANKVYTDIKSKLISLYLDTTVKVCSNNSIVCEDAKEGLSELKQNFNITWDFIKDISGVGLSKLKAWYEVWKEK